MEWFSLREISEELGVTKVSIRSWMDKWEKEGHSDYYKFGPSLDHTRKQYYIREDAKDILARKMRRNTKKRVKGATGLSAPSNESDQEAVKKISELNDSCKETIFEQNNRIQILENTLASLREQLSVREEMITILKQQLNEKDKQITVLQELVRKSL